MTAEAHHYDDLHRLVDRLQPGQAEAVRAVMLQLVTASEHTEEQDDEIVTGETVETVSFALDGASYEIDLSNAGAAQLREALAEFVGHARPVRGRASEPSNTAPSRLHRQFSFAGSISAEPDFAARSEEILEEIASRNTT